MVDIKAIRILPFSGKQEDWNRWSKTFLATAIAKGNKEVIKPSNMAANADADQNTQVYNDLILSCQDDITFGIIDEAVSATFPDGDARMAWKNLAEKFEPSTGASKIQLKQEFNQSKLSNVETDPEEWITQLELKRRRLKTLGVDISDEDLMLHILNNLTKEYDTTVELCEEELSGATVTLTLNKLKERLRAKFNRIKKLKEDSDEAVALIMKKQFKSSCSVCGKIGHKGTDCFNLEKNKAKKAEYYKKKDRNKSNSRWSRNKRFNKNKSNDKKTDDSSDEKKDDNSEIVLMANTINNFGKNAWIADSGASCHMCNDLLIMSSVRDTDQKISIGDGSKMQATKKGVVHGKFKKPDGSMGVIVLTNVSYVPDLVVNLFSITEAMDKGCLIIGSKSGISLSKNDKIILTFHDRFGDSKGHVFGTTIESLAATALVSGTSTNKTYDQAHQVLGHPGKELMIATSKRLKWKLDGDTELPCEECLIAKAKRANVPKIAKHYATKPGERIMIDTSSVRSQDHVSGRFWLLVVDEATNMKWSFFIRSKKQQVPVLEGFIKTLKELGHPVKHIRCDNAGENESLKKKLDADGSTIRFEFTARQTPQQNGKVERAFASLYGRMRAMMLGAGLDASSKLKLWMEAAATATKLDNILSMANEESPYKKFYGKDPDYQNHLQTFGELAIVTKNPGGVIKSKLDDRGEKCMFLGYAANHAANVYRMYNMSTGKVMITRDVKWTGKINCKNAPENNSATIDDFDDDILPIINNNNQVPNNNPVPNAATQRMVTRNTITNTPLVVPTANQTTGRALSRNDREMRRLTGFNNPGRIEIEGPTNQFCFFVPTVDNDTPETTYEDPKTFDEAWNHPDPTERHFWREAIRLEFRQMLKNRVWRKEGMDNLPPNRKGIGTKWVFKKKKNGVYRARLVVKGYSKQEGHWH